jgi:hypothetical protein
MRFSVGVIMSKHLPPNQNPPRKNIWRLSLAIVRDPLFAKLLIGILVFACVLQFLNVPPETLFGILFFGAGTAILEVRARHPDDKS